ncbi:MAG TPA: AI-2E family transporter [Rhizomicrobium sp.]|nr:AI-2E family transporter [Rhizomicrobium sp.]
MLRPGKDQSGAYKVDEPKKRLTIFQINATVAAAGALALCAAFVMSRILPAILWSFVLAIALWPSFQRIKKWRRSRGWHRIGAPAALTLLVGILVAAPLGLAAIETVRETNAFLAWINEARIHGVPMPAAIADLPWIGSYASSWWQTNLSSADAASDFFAGISPRSLLGLTRNLGPEVFHRALLFAITLLTLFFLFRDGEDLWHRAMPIAEKAFGSRSRPIAHHVIDAIHGTVDGLVLVGFAEGLVIGVGYVVTGVPHSIAFAIATAIVAAIPFGAPLVFCLAALLLASTGKVLAGIGVAVFGFLIVFIVDHFVRPFVIGGATRIPFLLVLLGILGGLSSLGLVGLFVGPALMAIFTQVWRDLTLESAEP